MGYRSDGKLFIPNKLHKKLPTKIEEYLKDWDTRESHNDGIIYSFEWRKWYDGFLEVDTINKYYYDNKKDGVDMIVIGEDNAIIVEPQFNKFGYSMDIKVY